MPIIVSHLSFANDVVVFANRCHQSLQQSIDFLHYYESVLVQLICQAKSSFYINGLAFAFRQAIVHFVTGFPLCQLPFIYFKCIVFARRLKISHFDNIVRKNRDRISGSTNWLLSLGGKQVLIKHVLFSMLVHLFHVLCPPIVVVQHLERLFS